jgi:RNA polymerase sigma-70 factor (ECF subfamily)
MHERANVLVAGPVSEVARADELTQEFERRLADSSSLAFRVAYSVLRNRQDAEDAAQEAFVRAFRKFRDLREREKFRGWLVKMTWTIALDRLRANKRRLAREDTAMRLQTQEGNAESDAIAAERSARLWVAIDALPEKLRLVTVLQAIEGHSVRDIAEWLGAPEGTIKSRLFDARQKLQEWLR